MTASAAPDRVEIFPVPTYRGAILSVTIPDSVTTPCENSAIATVSTPAPDRVITPPLLISLTDVFSESLLPKKEKSICSSSGLNAIDSAAPDSVDITPKPW